MNDYTQLINVINQNIKKNGVNSITGDIMNSVLKLITDYNKVNFENVDQVLQVLADNKVGNVIGSVKPTDTASFLNTLPSGIYYAYGEGAYNFNPALQIVQGSAVNIIPSGYSVKFLKNANIWSVSTVEKLPAYDDTSLVNRIDDIANSSIPPYWLNYSIYDAEYFNFTLSKGQVMLDGSINDSVSWLHAKVYVNPLADLNIEGLGIFNFNPKTPPYVRVAFYNSSNVMLSKIDWIDGVNTLTVTTPTNVSYMVIQVDGGTNVGANLESSIFLTKLKVFKVNNSSEPTSIKSEFVEGGNLITVDASITNSTNTIKKTINEAIESIKNQSNGTILIKSGDYREVVNFRALKNGNYNLICKTPNSVRILGSDNINNFTLTSGLTNTYQVPFTKTILKGLNNRFDQMIFEDGKPSMLINPTDIHPLQKSLSYRLPFTALVKKTSINDVENTPGSFALISNILYIHTSNSSNPNTNGFKYEVIQRDLNTVKDANTNDLTNIYLENLQFLYGKTALKFIGFNSVTRLNVTSLANLDAGAIRDDTCNVFSINDEAGFCDGDGINGHYNANTSYNTLTNNRTMSPVAIYHNAWCHDCHDDGLSHHENHRVTLYGGLFEYNGDGGVRASNDANYDVYNATARGNGFRSDRSIGEGFGVVNPILNPNRNACKMNLYNCISYNNMVGYGSMGSGNILNVYNCISRYNINAELYADTNSILNSYNNKATNTNSSKIKIIASGGVINVINDLLID